MSDATDPAPIDWAAFVNDHLEDEVDQCGLIANIRAMAVMSTPAETFDKLLGNIVESSRHFKDPAARAESIIWFMKRIPTWMSTALAEEN